MVDFLGAADINGNSICTCELDCEIVGTLHQDFIVLTIHSGSLCGKASKENQLPFRIEQ